MIILWSGIYICMIISKLLYHILKLPVGTNFNFGLLKPEYDLNVELKAAAIQQRCFQTSKSCVYNSVQKRKMAVGEMHMTYLHEKHFFSFSQTRVYELATSKY